MIRKTTRKFVWIGTFSLSLFAAQAQTPSTHFKKDTLKKTEISILYNHYLQDGNHSAVTGGTGTEALSVYAPSIRLETTNNKKQTWGLQAGVDVITSASTDNINFVLSSASRIDQRGYMELDFTHQLRKKEIALSYATGFSAESDYLSIPLKLGIATNSKNNMRSYSLDLQMFFDDLRWGRFDEDYYRPAMLVYPRELRDTEWQEEYLRQSYNIKFGFTQIVNNRLIIGAFPALVYQHGLLSTPFHRVYFSDGTSLKVENLPIQRTKLSLGFKANAFIGGQTVIKQSVDLYKDDFGVKGLALENETAFKLNHQWTMAPFFRFYVQEGSKYFAPYKAHNINQIYYTSDFDLSDFTSYKFGLSVRYSPFYFLSKKWSVNEISLRYAYYHRSDGMRAHIIGFVCNGAFIRKDKKALKKLK